MSLSVNTVLTGTVTGRNGNGSISFLGARVGDLVYCTPSTSNSFTNGNSELETTISVNDQIQQTLNANLTATTFAVFLFRPIADGC